MTTSSSRYAPQERKLPPVPIQYGSVRMNGTIIPIGLAAQQLPGLRVGPEVTREGREGIVSFRIDDLSGGFMPSHGIESWVQSKNRYYFNEGIWGTWQPKIAVLPYKNTSNATLTAVDHSGFRAANKRMHSAMFNSRWYGFLGTQLFKDTSTSDPAVTVPGTADGVTELVTACGVMIGNGTRYLAYAGSTTDDIQGATDPSGADLSAAWTKIVTLSDTPYINALGYLNVGPGINYVIGRPSTSAGAGVFHFRADVSLPASLQPTPLSGTEDTPNSSAGVLSSTKQAGSAYQLVTTPNISTERFQNLTNVFASDNAYVTMDASMEAGDNTPYLVLGNYGFNIPTGSILTGSAIEPEVKQSDTDDDVVWGNGTGTSSGVDGMEIVVSNAFTGIKYTPSTSELSTSDTTYTVGGSTQLLAPVSPAEVNDPGFGVALWWRVAGTGATANISVDACPITLYYRPPGTMPTPALGGWSMGVQPSKQNRVVCVEPETDELTTILINRRLVVYDFEWDSQADRALVERAYPNTGLPYVGAGAFFAGGIAVAGGSNRTLWNQVKLIDSSGQTRDINFPSTHGTNALTITRMEGHGNVLLVDTAYSDGSEAQQFLYYNGKWFAAGVQQDKASAISTEPILWAETTRNLEQNFLYRFYPVSTTNLAVAREFWPSDPFADPHLANTSQTKQDGPLYVQLVELDVGPEEANKSLLAIQQQTRRVDDNTSYGSARWLMDTGGDKSIAAAEVDQTFDAASECFTDRSVGAAGIAFKTLVIRGVLDHQSGSAETPNLLPMLLLMTMQFPHLETFRVMLSEEQTEGPVAMFNRLKTQANTKVSQAFKGGGYDCNAVLVDVKLTPVATLGTMQPTWKDMQEKYLDFRRVVGSSS